MKVWLAVLVLLGVLLYPRDTEAASKNDSYQLYQDMFRTSGYNKYVRPTEDTSTPTYIYLAFGLVSLVELNEKSQSMKTNARMLLGWDDELLSWDTSRYGGQKFLFTAQENLWVPDLMVDNSVVKQQQIGFDDLPVRITSDGIVLWTPNILTETSCDIEVTYYPFDTQLCYIDFITQITNYDEVDVNIDQTEAFNLEEFSPDGTWELTDHWAANQANDGEKSKIRFSLLFKRRTTFYVINIILPVLFLSLTAALVFALPSDSGEKMGTSITVLLAYAVYLTIVTAYLPNTSLQTSILALYLTILLGITALSVVVSVFVLRIYFRPETEQVKPWQRKVTVFLRTILFLRKGRPGGSEDNKRNVVTPISILEDKDTDVNERAESTVSDPPYYEEHMSWHLVASTIDWLCFLTFSTMVIVTTIVCMVILVVGGSNNAPTINKTT